VTDFPPPTVDDALLLEKLKLWSDRLLRIELKKQRVHRDLADLGVLPKAPFKVCPGDGPKAVRLKERLISACREQQTVLEEMKEVGAEVLDETTMEIGMPGGPEPSSVLSWMPGETCLGFWRREKALSGKRYPLYRGGRARTIPSRQ
jgi:hypothetical protein